MNDGNEKVFKEHRRAVRVRDKVNEFGGRKNKIGRENNKVIII